MQSAMVLCRFLHFTVVLLMFGVCAFRPLLLKPQQAPDQRLIRLMRWLALPALISGVGWLMITTGYMVGDWQASVDWQMLQQVLTDTFFGKVWSGHLVLNLLLIASLFVPAMAFSRLQLLLSTLILVTLAPVGHGAMLEGISGDLLILNQSLHLLCTGAWVGGLMLLSLILLQPSKHPVGQVLRTFSNVGYCLVAGILLTGLINVRALTGAFWPTPLLSGFALILLIKVSLVGAMLILALFNRLKSQSGQLGVLRASVILEWLLGLGAVAAVSLLGTLPPVLGS